jgi:ribosomal protein S12
MRDFTSERHAFIYIKGKKLKKAPMQKYHVMKGTGRTEVKHHIFLNSVLVRGE